MDIGTTTGLQNNAWIPYVYPSQNNPTWSYTYTEPTICTSKVHVFSCSHCKKCQCGKLELPADAT